MSIDEIHSITKVLDLLGIKEHIFFMSDEEYRKEFDFIFTQYPKRIAINGFPVDNILSNLLIESISIDGIVFHILDIEKTKTL